MTSHIFWPPAKDLAVLFGVDITTARRWRRGAICPPKSVVAIVTGDLGIFSDYWRDWYIRDGNIVSPDGWVIRRNDALSVPLMLQQISALRLDIKRLKAELEAIQAMPEQPLPGTVRLNETSR